MKLYKSLFFIFIFLPIVATHAQEYAVKSFEIVPDDLSARTNGRVDGNGKKCAIVKINVPDRITQVQGSVVGDIVDKGMQKWVYLTPDTKKMEVFFQNHLPLMITFRDFNYPTVSTEMVYSLTLVEPQSAERNSSPQSSSISSSAPSVSVPSSGMENSTISGMVSDAKRKEPLLAVSVINETPNRGVSTDLDGCYTLTNVKKGDIIQFSYLGYKQIEIRILEKVPPVLNVSMKEGKGNEYRELFYDPDDTSKYYDLKGKELPARPTAKGIYLRVKDGHPERLEIK